jgi:transcriptional regulator of acetoin/glycerol metabolism
VVATRQVRPAARGGSEAAARLGIDRSTLYRQLARYGLRRRNTLDDS